MTDVEAFRVAWFRGPAYQDLARFLAAQDGFARHRWGDHAVRTLATALLADDAQLATMDLPYRHQRACQCPGGTVCADRSSAGNAPRLPN